MTTFKLIQVQRLRYYFPLPFIVALQNIRALHSSTSHSLLPVKMRNTWVWAGIQKTTWMSVISVLLRGVGYVRVSLSSMAVFRRSFARAPRAFASPLSSTFDKTDMLRRLCSSLDSSSSSSWTLSQSSSYFKLLKLNETSVINLIYTIEIFVGNCVGILLFEPYIHT